MSGRFSLLQIIVLVMTTDFSLRSSGFQWLEPVTSSSEPSRQALKSVVYSSSRVSVSMKWKWRLSGSEAFNGVVIKRYRVNNRANTETELAYYLVTAEGVSSTFDESYYSQHVNAGNVGDITFTIKDIAKQSNNKDGGAVHFLQDDYVFRCEVRIANASPVQRTSEIKLFVIKKPMITTAPTNKYIDKADKQVHLKCIATGKPQPVIEWYIMKRYFTSARSGSDITINRFRIKDVGLYKCIAKNAYGEDTAQASLQYTYCGNGCSMKDDIAIQIKNLNYYDGYNNIDSKNYRKLKKNIENECMLLDQIRIYSCVVTQFRRGSVIANIKLTYPTGTSDPAKPLRDAIKSGRFAGYNVTTAFVSPTSYTTTKFRTFGPGPPYTPDAGQRGSSGRVGLSIGAIIAIISVIAIVFVLSMVAVVYFLIRRKRNNPSPNAQPSTLQREVERSFDVPPPYNPAFHAEQRTRPPCFPDEPPPAYDMVVPSRTLGYNNEVLVVNLE